MTLAELRAAKWRAQKKKSTTRLSQDSDSLQLHLQRANYLSFLQKHPTLQSHPSPLGHGWQLVDGLCLPVRYDLPALPSLIPVTLNMTDDEEREIILLYIRNDRWRQSWIFGSGRFHGHI